MKASPVVLLAFATQLFSQTTSHQAEAMQHALSFSMEDEPGANAVAIPPQIWAILRNDHNVQNSLTNQEPSLSEPPRSWFAAFPVSLRGEGASDLVVEAEDRLSGVNVTHFWIFLQTPDGPKLVLTVPAHDLAVMATRWHGYRKIEAAAATATGAWNKTFCFNGSEYAPCHEG